MKNLFVFPGKTRIPERRKGGCGCRCGWAGAAMTDSELWMEAVS